MSREWRPWLWLAALIGAAVVLCWAPRSGRAKAVVDQNKPRVGLVFDVGGRGDKSFNDAAYAGLSRAERELGVQAFYLEPAGSEDREAALRLFAAQGYDLVIGVGFIFSNDINQVAADYPHVHFACIDYAPPALGPPPNVAGLAFREEEGSFLVGVVAGTLSRSRHVGFVGGMTIPLIRKFEAGYAEGVRAACPSCAIHVAYAGSTPDAFRDPARGKALSVSHIAMGADVIYHAAGATGHGVFEAAREHGIKAIGVDSDQYDEMPEVVVTSMVKRADVAVFDVIRDAVSGGFRGGMRVFGLKEQGVDYVHEGEHGRHLTDAVRTVVEKYRQEVVSGARTVPSN